MFAHTRQFDRRGHRIGKKGEVWLSLPDVYEAMLSTGVRIGELLAIMPDDVDPAERTVTISHHVVRVKGEGLVRQRLRKGREEGIVLKVPSWSVPMWRQRKLASGGGPLFPGWRGGLLDPSNTINRVREAFNACGFEWVTSHVFRKTVATIMDEAGIPVTAIADQLGNNVNTMLKHYRGKRAVNELGAEVLEGVFGEDRDAG
jgi:integrase